MITLPKPMPLGNTHVGQPVNRVDGVTKVTGQAKYAADYQVPDLLYGFVVVSAIARGKMTRLHTAEARAIPGVTEIITHENRPKTSWWSLKWKDLDAPPGSPFRPLHDEKIHFSDQPIAVVIATTPELARHAASRVRAEYEVEPHQTDPRTQRAQSYKPSRLKAGFEPPPSPRGNAEKAYDASPLQIDAEYSTPVEHHNAMELHASTVVYQDGSLTIYDKTQGVRNSQSYVARVFGLPKKKVRVLSPFVGGAFGSGLRPSHQLFLAVAASLMLKRSVRVVLTRQQTFSIGHRPETIQRIALGANADGQLQSLQHDVLTATSRFEDYIEIIANWSTLLYHCANTRQSYEVVALDIFTPLDMRAPGGATGVYAIECAIDELACQAGIDPMELRLRNYAERDDDKDREFSSKELRACYAQAAEKFDWSRRAPTPGTVRQGRKRIGFGMANGVWEAMQMPAGARVVLDREGHLTVSSATADIGTGTYTIMTQIAADAMGLPMERVTFKLGDSDLPFSLLEGGSWTAASVGTAVMAACSKLRRNLYKLAREKNDSPLHNIREADVVFTDGRIQAKADPRRGVALTDLVRGLEDGVELKATVLPHLLSQRKYARYTHSAVFAEVHVDEDLGRVQVMKMTTAVAAGRILNPKTARSQVVGGLIWGIGMALEEETHTDHQLGRFLNHSLAEYHIPVQADVRELEVIFIDEHDPIVSPIGVKGLGEIGIVGAAAAIANAVYNATGKRIRDLPITLDKLL